MNRLITVLFSAALLLSGCTTPVEPVEPVVVESEAMTYLEAGLRPETLLFPEYLLMVGYELNQHGWIPKTGLVGVGMKTEAPLKKVRESFSDILQAYGWTTEGVDIGSQSFRMMARLRGEALEIRAVQGRGPTQIFILYTPPL